VHKTYYDTDGAEVISENFLTGDIILTEAGKNRFFRSKSDFVVYYLTQADLNVDRIFYNSLSVPFFVTGRYCSQVKALRQNVLFWQEPVRDDIPGNMRSILENDTAGTDVIAVQTKEVFEKIRAMKIDQSRFRSLGFVYPRCRENRASHNALIFTNSDQIEKLGELAEALPEIQFHVGAITEMSSRLLQMAGYSNIRLYPTITEGQIAGLWEKCDLYLDINSGNEILSAVETAFVNRDLLFAFENTVHNRHFVSAKNLYKPENYRDMAAGIKSALSDKASMERELEAQWKAAQAASAEDYRNVIG
ncbi:MAG: accessory Sec system glycosylation chaperone GtfB, partial [Clostridiales bacterium]|nr:accessory Sec system glycosylation chaperone GtfB [Clostridiales bacterium]